MAAEGLKIQPQDLDAERAVLGAMLLSPDGAVDALTKIKASHFYKTAHTIIFKAMASLFSDGIPIDILTLSNRLTEQKQLSSVGGAFYITGLSEEVPSAANILYYCDLVIERANERLTISACESAIRGIYSRDITSEEAHANFMATMDKIDSGGEGYQSLDDIVPIAEAVIEGVHKGGTIPGISTGFVDLDRKIGGFSPGELVVLAGRPSMGKTALGLEIMIFMAKNGHSTALASIESGSSELIIRRLMQARSNEDPSQYTRGYITKEAMGAMRLAAPDLRKIPFYIDDSSAQTLQQIRSRASRMKARYGITTLMVDYMQLMSGSKQESRVQEIGEYCRGLKALARDLKITVLALSQLNREPEKRSDKRPKMSDLRETGDIEQDADKILFVYRPEVYKINKEPDGDFAGRDNENVAEIIIAKHRNGPTGTVELTFLKHKAQFFTREPFIKDDFVYSQHYTGASEEPEAPPSEPRKQMGSPSQLDFQKPAPADNGPPF